MERGGELVVRGSVYCVSGPAVIAKGMKGARMHTTCLVGEDGLLGEIIGIERDMAFLQIYEETSGLRLGDEVIGGTTPLTVLLGPGILAGVFDGIQRPLYVVRDEQGPFIGKGVMPDPLDMDRNWDFHGEKAPGDTVSPGEVVGSIQETEAIVHRVMVPPGMHGVIKEIAGAEVNGRKPVVRFEAGGEFGLYQRWPVRRQRPFAEKLPPSKPFITGQRVFDTLVPVAEGGSAVLPGGFGTGKTVVEQAIAKFARSDIVIYIGCGERGNEMTELLTDFPVLRDPNTGFALSTRTVIVVNTSNMPVAAREASIFTGITIAEYYRDMGYGVALMADSLSRWAEALREISSRLEEMPGEEGFPPYLATRLGAFYERAGTVECLGGGRRGSVTIISAVSPPGGDFSEPVTQASMRFAGTLWALDTDLAHRRHFPAINWKKSFSLYLKQLKGWLATEVAPDMAELRARLIELLQREEELNEVMQVIGIEALQDSDRLTIDAATLAKEAFLRQNAFSDIDAFATFEKQYWMLKALFAYRDAAAEAYKRGVYLEKIIKSSVRLKLLKMPGIPNDGFADTARSLIEEIEKEFAASD